MILIRGRCGYCGRHYSNVLITVNIIRKGKLEKIEMCTGCVKTKEFFYLDEEKNIVKYNHTYSENYSTLCPKRENLK